MSGFVGQVGAKSGKIGVAAKDAMFSGYLKSIQEFYTAGNATWTKPAGITHIMVYCTGAGGSGGGGGSGNQDVGAGGGSGGTAIRFYDVTGVTSCAIVIGTRGLVGANANSSAGGGTASTFAGPGATITGSGGGGGDHGNAGFADGGIYGAASGGMFNLRGQVGHNGCDDPGSQWYPPPQGGMAFWGGAGKTAGQGQNTLTDSVKGSGGAGNETAVNSNSASHGAVVVYEYA